MSNSIDGLSKNLTQKIDTYLTNLDKSTAQDNIGKRWETLDDKQRAQFEAQHELQKEQEINSFLTNLLQAIHKMKEAVINNMRA